MSARLGITLTMDDLVAYERETVEYMRSHSPRLGKLPIFAICALYHEWSESMYCAGWLMHSPSVTDEFIEWATRDMPCPARAWEKP